MNEIRARVIIQERGFCKIASEYGEKWAEVSGKFRHEAGAAADFPAVGDYCLALWPEDDSKAIITMLFPRRSCFSRKAAGKDRQEQVVAANIDYAFLCMALNNDFNLRRLERYLAIAWDSGATPIVLLTKKDLCEDIEKKLHRVERVAAGVDTLMISSFDASYTEVENLLEEGKTYAFLGSSGVGKSTLINRMMGEEILATNGLRNDDKGRHTTTHRQLISLKNGAFVIDTPGMRELGVWDNQEGISATFSDIEELERQCKFGNCSHTSEPGCAILAALAGGILDEKRWESYQKLSVENAYAADGDSYLREKNEKFKKIAKMNRTNKR